MSQTVPKLIKLKTFVVKRELFFDAKSNYGIYACEAPFDELEYIKLNQYGNFTVTGNSERLTLSQEYEGTFTQEYNPKFGHSYRIVDAGFKLPTNGASQRVFMEKFVAPSFVESIFTAYPNEEDVLKMIIDDKIDVSRLKGIGEKRMKIIKKQVMKHYENRKAFEFFGKYGLSAILTSKLLDEYKTANRAIMVAKENPYSLTLVRGFGFITCDDLAKSMGYDMRSVNRIIAGVKHVLNESGFSGNTYTTFINGVRTASDLLQVDEYTIENTVKKECNKHDNSSGIVMKEEILQLHRVYFAEKQISEKLDGILNNPINLKFDVKSFIKLKEEELGFEMTDEQRPIFDNILKDRINVLVAPGGCGKSFISNFICQMMENLNITMKLLSPTGKAARVLSSYVDREVSTIHRALQTDGDNDSETLISDEFIVIDEFGMVDVKMFSTLLKALNNPRVRILVIGDEHQLPSIGSGDLLRNMLEHKRITVNRMTKVFRQQDGGMLDIANHIRNKTSFIPSDFKGMKSIGSDAVFASCDKEKLMAGVLYFYRKALEKYKYEDILVLSPTNTGNVGVRELNRHLQEIANPDDLVKKSTAYRGVTFRVGDLVMNTQNLYRESSTGRYLAVCNGDAGKLINIGKDEMDEEFMEIQFDFGVERFSLSQYDSLQHCFSCTIHKSQGSSSPCVIMVASPSNVYFLNSNLLYTGLSRAKEFEYIVSDAGLFNTVIKRSEKQKRLTRFHEFLK